MLDCIQFETPETSQPRRSIRTLARAKQREILPANGTELPANGTALPANGTALPANGTALPAISTAYLLTAQPCMLMA